MSNLLSALAKIVGKSKKRVGRGIGSGRGKKSGRGTTRHQKARENIPLHFEGGQGRLVKRFPLMRGKGKNKARKYNMYVIYTRDLNKLADGSDVTADTLKAAGLVDAEAKKPKIKIIVKGKLERKLQVSLAVSRAAKLAIEKAGGSVR